MLQRGQREQSPVIRKKNQDGRPDESRHAGVVQDQTGQGCNQRTDRESGHEYQVKLNENKSQQDTDQSIELKNIRGSIQRLESQATEGTRGPEKKIGEAVARAVVSSVGEGSKQSTAAWREEQRFQELDRARKSLYIWPIRGGRDLKIREEMEDYMMKALLIDSFSLEWIEHVEPGPFSATSKEMATILGSLSTRRKHNQSASALATITTLSLKSVLRED